MKYRCIIWYSTKFDGSDLHGERTGAFRPFPERDCFEDAYADMASLSMRTESPIEVFIESVVEYEPGREPTGLVRQLHFMIGEEQQERRKLRHQNKPS